MHGTLVDFAKFIEQITSLAPVYPVREYARDDDKKILLRLDVDHLFDKAVEMAQIIHDAGVSASFYMLHTEVYYHRIDFFGRCRLIQRMGHEIGLHNNIVDVCEISGENPETMLIRELKYLRDAGLKVSSVAAHGTKLTREVDHRNYEIFEGCIPPYETKPMKIRTPLHEIRLEDHDLVDTAFLPIPPDFLLEDSHGDWHIIPKSIHDLWNPVFPKLARIRDGAYALKTLISRPDTKMIQVITHPWWWRE